MTAAVCSQLAAGVVDTGVHPAADLQRFEANFMRLASLP